MKKRLGSFQAVIDQLRSTSSSVFEEETSARFLLSTYLGAQESMLHVVVKLAGFILPRTVTSWNLKVMAGGKR